MEEINCLKKLFPDKIQTFIIRTKNSGLYVAMAVVYLYKSVFHTQYLDMNYIFSSEYPNLFLIHKLIKEALSRKMEYFSFGPSTENWGVSLNEGLYKYKRKFGSNAMCYKKHEKLL